MLKLIILYEDSNRRALENIIQNLKKENIEIIELSVNSWCSSRTFDNKPKARELANFYKTQNIDFGIIVTHNGNPSIFEFQKELKLKYGYYDLEHDLFIKIVEHSPSNQRLGVFVFTKYAKKYAVDHGFPYYMAKWYKFDEIKNYQEHSKESLYNAMYINTVELNATNIPFEYGHLFKNTYLKNWIPKETNSLLEQNVIKNIPLWWDTQAMVEVGQNAYFWFSQCSSALIEALMMKRIPILWRGVYKDEVQLDDIISEVTMLNDNEEDFHAFENKFKCITTTNIEHKINRLQNDPVLCEQVINILSQDWLFTEELHNVSDVLINNIKEKIKNG